MTPFVHALGASLLGLACLLATPASATPASAPELACLRLLQTGGLGNQHEKVCAAVLALPRSPADPIADNALRRLLQERAGTLPATALDELEQIPAASLAAHADNPVFLAYAARVVMAPGSIGRIQASTLARLEAIAGLALQQPALRTPVQLTYLQGLLVTTAMLQLHQRKPEGAVAWLARLEETCLDATHCFELYTHALLPAGEHPHVNSYRQAASLLAARHGIGDWRTGVAAMAIAGLLPPRFEDVADTRESIYKPFLAEWKKADVLARQPAAASWFIAIAGTRYETGDFRGAREAADLLWPKASAGKLHHVDMRRLAELAVNSRIALGLYAEAMALEADYARIWQEKYAPRLAITP